jgi:hypothetical protein
VKHRAPARRGAAGLPKRDEDTPGTDDGVLGKKLAGHLGRRAALPTRIRSTPMQLSGGLSASSHERFPYLTLLGPARKRLRRSGMDFLPLATLPDLDDLPPLPVVSDAEIGVARGYVEASRAASTRRAYDGDWRRFAKWCHERGGPCPARQPRPGRRLSVCARRGRKESAHDRPRAGRDRPHP